MRNEIRVIGLSLLGTLGACSDGARPTDPPDGVWSYTLQVTDGGVTCGVLDAFLALDGDAGTLTGYGDGLLNCTAPGTVFGSAVVARGTWSAVRDAAAEQAFERLQGPWAAIEWRTVETGPNLIEQGYRYELDFDGHRVRRLWSSIVVATTIELNAVIKDDTLRLGTPFTREAFTLEFRQNGRVVLTNTDVGSLAEGTMVLDRLP